MTFSSGVHFCLGQQLARVETQCALSRLYARYPNLKVAAPHEVDYIERLGVRGVTRLPVLLDPTRAQKAA